MVTIELNEIAAERLADFLGYIEERLTYIGNSDLQTAGEVIATQSDEVAIIELLVELKKKGYESKSN